MIKITDLTKKRPLYLQAIQVKFVYEVHRINVRSQEEIGRQPAFLHAERSIDN